MNSSDLQKDSSHVRRVFATTSWSMVAQAGLESTPAKSKGSGPGTALNELCQTYWVPLYAFARKKGNDREAAEDLTQAFFAHLLEKNGIAQAQQEKGRFRTFLLTAFSNFMTNEWRAGQALKRGGGQAPLSLDFEDADRSYSFSPTNDLTPERVFERTWALTLLNETMTQLKEHYEGSGKGELFDALKSYMAGKSDVPYADVAAQLSIKEGAVKVAVHRLRERYGDQLRMQIARTLNDPSEVDDELRKLFIALGNSPTKST